MLILLGVWIRLCNLGEYRMLDVMYPGVLEFDADCARCGYDAQALLLSGAYLMHAYTLAVYAADWFPHN